jgi:hypothetical protein
MKTRICIVALVIALVALAVMAPTAGAQTRGTNPGVIPPQASPGGMTYGEWGAAWWQWAMAIPKADNPLNDPTGDLVANGQKGHVWFLCGTVSMTPTGPTTYVGTADRKIRVPAGKMLFFPVINVEMSVAEGNGATQTELAAMCDWYMDHTTAIVATIDGKSVKRLGSYRAQSALYDLWWPLDNVVDLPPISVADPMEATSSVADGFWLMLAPLSKGKHVLHWEGATVFDTQAGDDFDATWAQDITYHLTVR